MSEKKREPADDGDWETIESDDWEPIGDAGPLDFNLLNKAASGTPLTDEERKQAFDMLSKLAGSASIGFLSPFTLGWAESVPGAKEAIEEFPRANVAGQIAGTIGSVPVMGGPISSFSEMAGTAAAKMAPKNWVAQRLANLIGSGTANLGTGAAIVGASNLPEGVDRSEAVKETLTDPLSILLSYGPEAIRQLGGGKRGAEVSARKFTHPQRQELAEEARAAGRSGFYDRDVGDPVGRELIEQGVFGEPLLPRARGATQEAIAKARNEAGKQISPIIKEIDMAIGGGVDPREVNTKIDQKLKLRKTETNYSRKKEKFDAMKRDFLNQHSQEIEIPDIKISYKDVPVGDPQLVGPGTKKVPVEEVVIKKDKVVVPVSLSDLYNEKVNIQKQLSHSPLMDIDAQDLDRFERAKMRAVIDIAEDKSPAIGEKGSEKFKKIKKTFGALEQADEDIRNSRTGSRFQNALGILGDNPLAISTVAPGLMYLGGRAIDVDNPEYAAGLGAILAGAAYGPGAWVNFLNKPQTRMFTPMIQQQRVKNMEPSSAWEEIE